VHSVQDIFPGGRVEEVGRSLAVQNHPGLVKGGLEDPLAGFGCGGRNVGGDYHVGPMEKRMVRVEGFGVGDV